MSKMAFLLNNSNKKISETQNFLLWMWYYKTFHEKLSSEIFEYKNMRNVVAYSMFSIGKITAYITTF